MTTLDRPVEPPVYGECVIGYRSWRLKDWALTPVTVGPPWRPGVNHARCRCHDNDLTTMLSAMSMLRRGGKAAPAGHSAPHEHCDCGYYAYHDLAVARIRLSAGEVVGAIAAWGNLEVHADGFRAEYAQIVALSRPDTPERQDGFDFALQMYRVPDVPPSELAREAERHGRPLPSSARPSRLGAPEFETFVTGSGSILGAINQAAAVQLFGTLPKVPPVVWSPPKGASVLAGFDLASFDPVGGFPRNTFPPDVKSTDGDVSAIAWPKRESNRQGPPRPKRPPRHMGGAGR